MNRGLEMKQLLSVLIIVQYPTEDGTLNKNSAESRKPWLDCPTTYKQCKTAMSLSFSLQTAFLISALHPIFSSLHKFMHSVIKSLPSHVCYSTLSAFWHRYPSGLFIVLPITLSFLSIIPLKAKHFY